METRESNLELKNNLMKYVYKVSAIFRDLSTDLSISAQMLEQESELSNEDVDREIDRMIEKIKAFKRRLEIL